MLVDVLVLAQEEQRKAAEEEVADVKTQRGVKGQRSSNDDTSVGDTVRQRHPAHRETPAKLRHLAEEDQGESMGCCDSSQMPPKSDCQWHTVVVLGCVNVAVAVVNVALSYSDDWANFSNLTIALGATIGPWPCDNLIDPYKSFLQPSSPFLRDDIPFYC